MSRYVRDHNQTILDILDRIKAEIEEEYGGCYICEWDEDYDYFGSRKNKRYIKNY